MTTTTNPDEKVSARKLFTTRPLNVLLSYVEASPLNPRQKLDEEPLRELTESIRALGILEPLLVRSESLSGKEAGFQPRYEVIAGHRRFLAAQQVGLTHVPVIAYYNLSDREVIEIALVENLVRRDINPIEEANGYQSLLDLGCRQVEIAEKVRRSESAISNALRLLDLPEKVREMLEGGRLSVSHGKALLAYQDFPDVLVAIAESVVKQKIASHVIEKEIPEKVYADLVQAGLVRRLESYGTPFEWRKVCLSCPFGAYQGKKDGSYSLNFCLKPDHFDTLSTESKAEEERKVVESIVRAKEAAAPRVEEKLKAFLPTRGERNSPARSEGEQRNGAAAPEAASSSAAPAQAPSEEVENGKSATPGILSLREMPHHTYAQLNHDIPAGCDESCPCRVMALDYGGKAAPICLDPGRLNSLKAKVTRKAQKERKGRFEALQEDIAQQLQGDITARKLALLCYHHLWRTRTAVRRQIAAHLPLETAYNALRGALSGETFHLRDEAFWDILAALSPEYLVNLTVECLLKEEIADCYEEKRDGIHHTHWFLGRAAGKTSGEATELETEVREEYCAYCDEPIPPDLLGAAIQETVICGEAGSANEVRVLYLESGALVIEGDEGSQFCPDCAPEARVCHTCGDDAPSSEAAYWPKPNLCPDCAHKATEANDWEDAPCDGCGKRARPGFRACAECAEKAEEKETVTNA